MERSQKRSDVVEILAEKVFRYGFLAAFGLGIGTVLLKYRGEGYTDGIIGVLLLGGFACLVNAIRNGLEIRKVKSFWVRCCYCDEVIKLTGIPTDDFPCPSCNRMVPVQEGHIMGVNQVRCGYCNALNFYSDKTEVLLCEECNREVPISQTESPAVKHLPKGFAREDDDQLYELRLISHGNHKTEELIEALQQTLALNRNQVKQMLTELPVTLLTGIPKRKAEILQTQLSLRDAVAEYTPIKS